MSRPCAGLVSRAGPRRRAKAGTMDVGADSPRAERCWVLRRAEGEEARRRYVDWQTGGRSSCAGSGVLGGCWEAVCDVRCRLRRAQERAGRSPAGGGRRWEGVRLLCVCVAACGRRSQQCRGGSRAAAEGGGGRYVSNKVREAARCGAGWVVVVEQGLRRRSLWAGSLLGLGCSGCVSGRGRGQRDTFSAQQPSA